MTNFIKKLAKLEQKIYAADAHEAGKYADQLRDALAEAYPQIRDVILAANRAYEALADSVHYETSFNDLHQALSALEDINDN